MELRRPLCLLALAGTSAAALLVPDAGIEVDLLVVLLAAGVAATVMAGYGGPYLLLCLGEAFAVGIGTASLVLGVLFQPVIAAMLSNDDRVSLVGGGSMALVAAAGVLVDPRPIVLLLALFVVAACMIVGLLGFDAWMRRRFSSGGAV